jgi:serine/threonine protein kinase
MGTVYRAYDRALDRDVALKVLRADLLDPDAAARLEFEARILARLEHPGIVPVHDAGMLADGRVFYVMKLVRGERLERYARTATVTELLRTFLRVCETVGFAHARGVVHRDLKPSNLMVGSFGEVLVLDWGIARVMREESVGDPVVPGGERHVGGSGEPVPQDADTAPGTVLGTPGFMAPEQAQGWSHLVDARTDVYALGAILRALVGEGEGGRATPRPLVSIWTRACPSRRTGTQREALAADSPAFSTASRYWPTGSACRAGRPAFRKYQTAIVLILTYLVIRFLFLATRGL